MNLGLLIIISFGVFSAWFVLGCIILASVDDKEESLHKWATSFPIRALNPVVYLLTVCSWPVVLYFWYKYNRKERN